MMTIPETESVCMQSKHRGQHHSFRTVQVILVEQRENKLSILFSGCYLQSGLSYFSISTDLGQGSYFCLWPSNCSNTIYLEAILSPSNHFLIFVKNQLGTFALYMYSFSIKKILPCKIPYKVSWKIPFHSLLVDWIKIAVNSLFSKDLQCN